MRLAVVRLSLLVLLAGLALSLLILLLILLLLLFFFVQDVVDLLEGHPLESTVKQKTLGHGSHLAVDKDQVHNIVRRHVCNSRVTPLQAAQVKQRAMQNFVRQDEFDFPIRERPEKVGIVEDVPAVRFSGRHGRCLEFQAKDQGQVEGEFWLHYSQ